MGKLVSELLGSALLAVLSYAALIAALFVAIVVGDNFALPILKTLICAVFGLIMLNVSIKTFPKAIAFSALITPSELRSIGLTMAILFTLLFFHPSQYSSLATMQWPLSQSVIDLAMSAKVGVPSIAAQGIYFSYVWFGIVGVFYIIMGTYVPLAVWLGLIDAPATDLWPEEQEAPNTYELHQTIRKLESDLSNAEGRIEEGAAAYTSMIKELRNANANEQAIRQELMGTATRLSVTQKKLQQSERELRKQTQRNDDLHTALKDLEGVVTDLRTRLQVQNVVPTKKKENTKSTVGLTELLDDPTSD